MALSDFAPPRLLDNPHLQSVLASHRLRRWLRRDRIDTLQREAERVVLDCGNGVRLQGFYNASPLDRPTGLVVLLHGWEGSALSTYLCNTAVALQQAGFATFRLEFRDHGDGQHLNEGIFHSCLIDEVVGAVRAIADRWPIRPLLLSGFSLGGNFTLRVALRAPAAGVPLARAIAVCPVINPANAMAAMESSPWFYNQYFLLKWRRSLKLKQKAFPHLYDFGPWINRMGMRALTRELIVRHSEFRSLEDYLDGYSVAGDRLAGLQVPTSILTSEDDPIIPVADFRQLTLPDHATLRIVRHGGHCGFLENWRLESWAERFVVDNCIRAAA